MNGSWAVRVLSGSSDIARLISLQIACGCEPLVPEALFSNLARHGGVLLGIDEANDVRGAAVGFLGSDSQSDRKVIQARLKLHLALLLVHPQTRRQGMGLALMRALRRLAEAEGLPLITWEYDPLDTVCAGLSLHKLGAVCQDWALGQGEDAPDADGRPRLQSEWWVQTPRAASRSGGQRASLTLAHYLEAGAQQVNPAGLDAKGSPIPSQDLQPLLKPMALMEVPPSSADLAGGDPGLAIAWRRQVIGLLSAAFRAGYLLTDFLRLDGETYPRAFYVLSQGQSTLG